MTRLTKNNSILLEAKSHGDYSYPDMLVGMEKTHFNKDWYTQHLLLQAEGNQMLSIRQFVDFLTILKSGKAYYGSGKKVNSRVIQSTLNEIIQVRDPWRSENLDAYFINNASGTLKLNSHHQYDNGILTPKYSLPIGPCLMQDKTPGIDLQDWLTNATEQGLPQSTTKSGKLYYWHPRNGAIARFSAGSDGVVLDCGRGPGGRCGSFGVRPSRKKI